MPGVNAAAAQECTSTHAKQQCSRVQTHAKYSWRPIGLFVLGKKGIPHGRRSKKGVLEDVFSLISSETFF